MPSWRIVPADHKRFRNVAISRIIVETRVAIDMLFPQPKVDIEAMKEKYYETVAIEQYEK